MKKLHTNSPEHICHNTDVPWERQQGESEKAFEAFQLYRDMGLKRSCNDVYTRLSKSRQLISRWKTQWNWDSRAIAYDNYLDAEARKEAVKNLKSMTKRHIKLSMQLQAKALEALQNMPIEEMTAKDIKEYIKLATELERFARTAEANFGDDGGYSADSEVKIYLPEKEAL